MNFLNLYLKRVTWQDVRKRAESDEQADQMMEEIGCYLSKSEIIESSKGAAINTILEDQ